MAIFKYDVLIIGGGAAGYFAAIHCAEANPYLKVAILEKSGRVLDKVRISGGGRCNVTHSCFDPKQLAKNYPRGEREMIGPFYSFQPEDTIRWFENRGVPLKTEADGRMFPQSNKSSSILDCLMREVENLGVELLLQHGMDTISQSDSGWVIQSGEKSFIAPKVMIATGSSVKVWNTLKDLGLHIIEPVPSLFTFNIEDRRLKELPGISVPKAKVSLVNAKLSSDGPLLITHWGLSGPAVLRLSAWGAISLHQLAYQEEVLINWLGANHNRQKVLEELTDYKAVEGKKKMASKPYTDVPQRLWNQLLIASGVDPDDNWASLTKKSLQALATELTEGRYRMDGKSTFKEEFVTAGGVDLKEIDFKSFEAKRFPGLFFAGEVLNIDAITGGFNFQAAWTGGHIAGLAMVEWG
jgi:predicted Rossmann fold flavoprotein